MALKPIAVPLINLQAQLKPLRSRILAGWAQAYDQGSFINGPAMRAFESEVSAQMGVKHAIACNSGTDALLILLRAFGIGPGDEVLVPSFSFYATAEAVSLTGAKPVFCDIRDEDFLLDLSEVKKKLNGRTRAVLPVHLFGLPMDLRPLKQLLKGKNVRVLEDVAQAFGAPLPGGGYAGTGGDGGAISFYPTKNLSACGDAGMMLTQDDEIARLSRELREHGSSKRYYHNQIGYNSRMDELQAVALRVKLPYLKRWNAARARAARAYLQGMADLPLRLPVNRSGCVWHQFTVRVSGGRRDALKDHLAASGISTAVFYPVPMHLQKPYLKASGRTPSLLKVSEAAAAEVLSLPMFPELELRQIKSVISQTRQFFSAV